MEQPRGETSALGTLLTFVLLIVALGILWVYTGGPERASNAEQPFFTMPSVPTVPLGVGSSGTVSEAGVEPAKPTKSIRDYFYEFGAGFVGDGEASPYSPYVSLEFGEPRNSNPRSEYLIVRTSKSLESAVTITGWSLVGSSGVVAKIKEAAQIPFLGQVNVELPISVPPGSTIYVTTGRSPNGTSFRVNQCTGYFEQFQNFYPGLKYECPWPTDEMLRFPDGIAGNRACIEFIEDLNRCTFFTNVIPFNIGSQCQRFVLEELTYTGCINGHKNDPGFYKNEWRVFLNRDQELWASDYERIRLLDENGKLIDSISY